MTKVQIAVDFSNFTTDAKFRAWGQACSNALVACGLVRTTDTGQVNWATVLKPTAVAVKAGYEVYRFADTLQATKPVFIRIDYGSSYSGNHPGTWFNVGTATDGAGNLAGLSIGSKPSAIYDNAATTNAAAPAFFTHSLANGYLLATFGLGTNLTGGASNSIYNAGALIVERTKDAAGAVTGTGVGVTIWENTAATAPKDYGINFATSVAYGTARSPHCGVASTVMSMSSGTDIALYRHYIGIGGLHNAVGRLSHFAGDIVNGAQFAATPLGTTARNYYCWHGPLYADSSPSANIILDWLWED